MAGMVRVYLFGDQTYETNAKLCALLSSTGNPILASFLDQAFNVIRAEVGRLPLQQFRDLPSFTSLAEILARQRDGGLNPAFQTALSIIYQLGSFIRYATSLFFTHTNPPINKFIANMRTPGMSTLSLRKHTFWVCALEPSLLWQ
jgi:hypothetical protein